MVVIAEKPSLARAIRDALPPDPARTVVAARGHLLEPAPPDDYLPDALPRTKKGGKVWRWQDLPILPSAAGGWRKRPRMGARKQITEIRSALASAERVVNAGDPDREGQLLIDEIIAHCGYRGPVDRVWLQSLTPEAIRAAFGTLRPNAAYQPLSRAAEARQRADWVVGMNLTRAWTLSAGRLLSVGRVQTPTLALVVARDREIEEFRPHDFFEVHAGLRAAAGGFVARWRPTNTDGPGFDPEGRLIDRAAAERIVARARAARRGAIIEYRAEKKARAAPLPYSLSSLQKVASARLGLGAQQVLDAAQALYEGS
jgi:DNA topoisomerase-3